MVDKLILALLIDYYYKSTLKFVVTKEPTTDLFFITDLVARFPNLRLITLKKHLTLRPSILPIYSNLHETKKFVFFRGAHILVGNKNDLPPVLTFTGVKNPLVTNYLKTNFFFPPYYFLKFITSNINVLEKRAKIQYFLKTSLVTTRFIDYRWEVVKMAGISKPFRIVRTLNFPELNLLKKIRNFLKPRLKFTVFKNRFRHEANKFPKILRDQVGGRAIKNSWHIKNKVLSIRNNRDHLKRLFFLKSKQYVLSLFLKKLSKIKYSTMEKLVSHELSIPNILLRSGFAISLQEIKKYIKLGLIYINFTLCTSSNYKLQEKDIIQVVISKNFYSDYRYRLNSILSLNYKILKYKSDKLKVKKVFKQQAQAHTGGWVFKLLFLNNKLPRYLEVDWLTLSIFIVYKPRSLNDFNLTNLYYIKWLQILNYNWKFLYSVNNFFFNYWKPRTYNNTWKDVKSFNINFGPQHPASHGVLRMVLQLKGELIENVDTHIGLLHRGSEKLMETKNYLLGLPYLDRMDYVSVLSQEHGYCLAIETLLGTQNYQSFYSKIRVIFDELTRILNHLMGVCTHSLDVGCMAPLFWGFEEREKIMEFYERVSGARMHAAFYRPNDLSTQAITLDLLKDIVFFCRSFLKRIYMIESKLNLSTIWRHRLVNVGTISSTLATNWGVTGVLARSSGIKFDIRLSATRSYANYFELMVKSFTGINGDCYDRYLIRMREMVESTSIVLQVINKLTFFNDSNLNPFASNFFNYLDSLNTYSLNMYRKSNQLNWYNSMEELISHFKYYSEGFLVPKGVTYKCVESPRGEFGVFLVSDGSNKPYRVKIRSPSYYNLQPVEEICQGLYFADLVTLVGSHDIVMGEIDR